MIQDDFNQLLTATAEVFDVSRSEICRKYCEHTAKARWFMAHCIHEGLVHLRNLYIERTSCTPSTFFKNVNFADELIHESVDDLCRMNDIRARVGLPKLRHAVMHRDKISNTKTLFGFDYTENDALRLLNACRGAREYMNKLCKLGRQPIPDGMVYSSIRRKPTYDSWYND